MAIYALLTMSNLVLLALLPLFTSFTCLVTAQVVPPMPQNDPFYTPPAGYQSQPAGAVLRNRTVAVAAFGLVPELTSLVAYQLLYRTTAVDGTAIATVTTIFVPPAARNDRFVSFQTAEDSSNITCSPSYNYRLFSNQTNLIVAIEDVVIQRYLLAGWIVTSPDYEGPDSAFTAGHLEGMAVLDNMRAVNTFLPQTLINFPKDVPIVGIGYSGGAIATGWAANLRHVYAPELNIKGWISGGTPANLTGVLVYDDNGPDSGFLPAALDGLLKPSAYAAQLSSVITPALTTLGKNALAYANAHCVADDLSNFANQSVLSTTFQSYGKKLTSQAAVAAVLLKETMGLNKTETPDAPVLLYHSEQDEVIPYLNASTLFTNWCNNGANVHFTSYTMGGHANTELNGLSAAFAFAQSAFAGTVASGCSSSTVTPPSTFSAADFNNTNITIVLNQGMSIMGSNDVNLIHNATKWSVTVDSTTPQS